MNNIGYDKVSFVGMKMGNFFFFSKRSLSYFILFLFYFFVGVGPRVCLLLPLNIFQIFFFSFIKFFYFGDCITCNLLFS
jgi:hypothetical protein